MDDWTVAEAKAWLRPRLRKGATCPCCTQRAQIYRRRITSPMARGLIKQWRTVGDDYVHTAALVRSETHEFSQLSWWRLVEELPARRDDGGKAGWWRITDTGRAWVQHRVRVPKYAHVYDGRCIGLDHTETVSIIDALGVKFDYAELMGYDRWP